MIPVRVAQEKNTRNAADSTKRRLRKLATSVQMHYDAITAEDLKRET